MKIGGGCVCPDLLLNGKQDSRTIFRLYLEAHLKKKLLHVHVLDAVTSTPLHQKSSQAPLLSYKKRTDFRAELSQDSYVIIKTLFFFSNLTREGLVTYVRFDTIMSTA